MATKLSTDPSVYFVNFATGNDFTPSTYFQYAADMDTNFLAIRTSVNQLVDEVTALGGPNSQAPIDSLRINDPNGPVGVLQNGVIGQHSYEVSINGGDATMLDVQAGQAIAGGQRVESSALVNLTGSGGSGTRWVALDANGVPTLQTAATQAVLDIASINWNGTIFTGAVTQLARIFFDGDEYLEMRSRPVDTSVWSTGGGGVARSGFKVFRLFADRVLALERLISGRSTEGDGSALPALGLRGGTAALPAFVSTDGSGTRDTTTGWFRQAANVWAFAASAAEVLRLQSAGIRLILGSEGTPPYSFIGDGDTGIFSPGANRLAFTTAGNRALEIDELGNVDFVLQTRGEATATAFSLASGAALSSITLDAEVEDVGGSFSAPSADITVPVGANLRWNAILEVFFDESTSSSPNTGHREIALQFNGNDLGRVRVAAASSGDTRLTTTAEFVMGGAQVLRARAAQDSGGAMDVDARITWRKVA